MFDQILGWLAGDGAAAGGRRPRDELQLALAALLVEAAHSDDRFDDSERAVIVRLLEQRFGLSAATARELLAAAEQAVERSAELFHFIRVINDRLSVEERIELIEMLWEVAYADGVLDQYEDSLLRRIGGLIYIPDRERGMARRRVLKRLGLDAPA
jgi:uncharacterized tellurite resistance protein B-like protein